MNYNFPFENNNINFQNQFSNGLKMNYYMNNNMNNINNMMNVNNNIYNMMNMNMNNNNMNNMMNMNNNMNNIINMNNNMMNMNNNINKMMINMNNNMNNNNMGNNMNNIINMNKNMNNMININNRNMNFMNNMNSNMMAKNLNNGLIVIFRPDTVTKMEIEIHCLFDDKVADIIQRYRMKSQDEDPFKKKFIFNGKNLNPSLTLAEAGLNHKSIIFVINLGPLKGAGYALPQKEINIKFIKDPNNNNQKQSKKELKGLLKLCLLKEISPNLNDNQLNQLSEMISYILKLLKKGHIENEDVKSEIIEVLAKMEGSSIINFAKYVDETINSKELQIILNLLKKDELNEIIDIQNRLSKYNNINKLFDEEFEKAKKESIFEFSVVSLVIIEREDFEIFKKEGEKCPNREEKILFHGTSIKPISCILTGYFKKSVDRGYQHGKGVYFTDLLDYCWFYGGEKNNRINKNKIPKVDETFTLIACSVYYDKNGFRIVTNSEYTPKKNEINFAYAGANFETLKNVDKSKFVGTEYVIWDLNQICPFMSAKLKRNEYCVIWRDDNFSPKPVYHNEFDETFKKFLKERKKYIEQVANFNIYTFDNSEDALKLINKKKYNKIILISNVGKNFGGRDFITKARKIIGNDVIALFLAYKKSHLDQIKDFKNALFSNNPEFYEKYLECFTNKNLNIKSKINYLKESIERNYNVTFNFNDKFLDFPYYKESGKYSDLTF